MVLCLALSKVVDKAFPVILINIKKAVLMVMLFKDWRSLKAN